MQPSSPQSTFGTRSDRSAARVMSGRSRLSPKDGWVRVTERIERPYPGREGLRTLIAAAGVEVEIADAERRDLPLDSLEPLDARARTWLADRRVKGAS